MSQATATIIGSGIGGLSLGIRLQSLGIQTTIVERMRGPGGRAAVMRKNGFVWDMGPTVLTVPHFIEELFALECGDAQLDREDFSAEVLAAKRVRHGSSGGPRTSEYVDIVPILPFYRIYFDDGTFFDYDGAPVSTRRQSRPSSPSISRVTSAFTPMRGPSSNGDSSSSAIPTSAICGRCSPWCRTS